MIPGVFQRLHAPAFLALGRLLRRARKNAPQQNRAGQKYSSHHQLRTLVGKHSRAQRACENYFTSPHDAPTHLPLNVELILNALVPPLLVMCVVPFTVSEFSASINSAISILLPFLSHVRCTSTLLPVAVPTVRVQPSRSFSNMAFFSSFSLVRHSLYVFSPPICAFSRSSIFARCSGGIFASASGGIGIVPFIVMVTSHNLVLTCNGSRLCAATPPTAHTSK